MTEAEVVKKPSFWMAAKYRIVTMSVMLTGLVASASAAIDLSNISDLIVAITGVIPDIIDLVTAIVPLMVYMALISFLIGLLASILGIIKFKF